MRLQLLAILSLASLLQGESPLNGVGIVSVHIEVSPPEGVAKLNVKPLVDSAELLIQQQGLRVADIDKIGASAAKKIAFVTALFNCGAVKPTAIYACAVEVEMVTFLKVVDLGVVSEESQKVVLARSAALFIIGSAQFTPTQLRPKLEEHLLSVLNEWRKANPKP